MRDLIDMTDAQVEALGTPTKRMRQSRAAPIGAAIDNFLHRHHREQAEEAFGIWGAREVDGLAYQEKARREWQASCAIPISPTR